jgi:hypothetical protein
MKLRVATARGALNRQAVVQTRLANFAEEELGIGRLVG